MTADTTACSISAPFQPFVAFARKTRSKRAGSQRFFLKLMEKICLRSSSVGRSTKKTWSNRPLRMI